MFPSAELAEAAASGSKEHVRLALQAGADPNSSDGSHTALQRACLNGNTEIAMLLIEQGVAVNMPAPGATPCSISIAPPHAPGAAQPAC